MNQESEKISSVFIATSLDGFIARSNGQIDWLDQANKLVPDGEDCGFLDFLNSTDTMVMGRKTFETVLSIGQWPYGETPVYVLSRQKVEIPEHLSPTVYGTSETPVELTQRLKDGGSKKLYIDGGATIQSFLKEKLIRDLTITVIPTLIGEGTSLFGSLKEDIQLNHIQTKTYDFGFVQSTYGIEYK